MENSLNKLMSKPRDCSDILDSGESADGVYTVYLTGYAQRPVEIFCDMTTDGGGWTVCITIIVLTVGPNCCIRICNVSFYHVYC